MRVYWSGAALMLMADTHLRSASGGKASLDSVLQSLQHCCMENGKSWRARELMLELDRLGGTKIFSRLYRDHVHNEEFPNLEQTWQALGVKTRFNRVRMVSDAPLSGVRDAIMKG